MSDAGYVPITKLIKQRLGVSDLRDLYDLTLRTVKFEYAEPLNKIFEDWMTEPPQIPVKKNGELRPILVSHGHSDWRLSSRALLVGESFALIQLDRSDSFYTFAESVAWLEEPIDRQLVVLIPESLIADRPSIELHRIIGMLSVLGNKETLGPLADLNFSQISECLIGLYACSRFPGRVDLVSRDSNSTAVYRYLLESFLTIDPSAIQTHDQLSYFPRLLKLPLPDFQLPVTDMIHVRDDGLFDDWRMAFSRTLTQLRDPGTLLTTGESETVKELERELNSVANQLGSRIERWRSLRKALVGMTGLSVACTAGALQAGAGTATSSAIGGGSYLTGMIAEYLGSRPSRGIRAFRRLIVQLFDPEEG